MNKWPDVYVETEGGGGKSRQRVLLSDVMTNCFLSKLILIHIVLHV